MITPVALLTSLALAVPMGHGKQVGPRDTIETRPCTVKVTGAVTATFQCTMSARFTSGNGLHLVFSADKLPRNVGAFLAGPFEIQGPIEEKVPYGPASFRSGRMMLSGPRHAAYAAEVGATPRGDLSVIFASIVASAPAEPVGSSPAGPRAALAEHRVTAAGTLGGRLVPKQGQRAVEVTISF